MTYWQERVRKTVGSLSLDWSRLSLAAWLRSYMSLKSF